jgi:predicted AlkP superfamily phosphohydrolase/phosphomutase
MSENPLAIICLDAGDAERILSWAQSGLLPTMSSILERGTHGRLSGPEMISIHGVWTTFFSGVSLYQHGRYLPRTLEPGTYRMKEHESHSLPFWEDFRDGQRKVVIVDAPDMKVTPGVAGFQVADWGAHFTNIQPSCLPKNLLTELPAHLRSHITTNEIMGTRRKDRKILKEILKRVEKKGELCRYLLNKNRWDLAVVGFGDCHAASHRFEKYQNTGNELEKGVLEVYQAVDREIGRLLQAFPENTNCFIVSDSGILKGYPIMSEMNSLLIGLGYQILLERSGIVRNIFRFAQERCLPAPWELWMLEKQLKKRVDWSKTTAFMIPGYYTGYVRVNLKGREPNGIVAPGAEYESVLDRLESDFNKLTDEKTNEPVIERINRTASLFGGGAPPQLPDLIVDWFPAKRSTRTILHPRIKFVQKKRRSRGNYHSAMGFITAAGPSIPRNGESGDFSPLHFASLFGSLLNDSNERFRTDFPLSAFVRKSASCGHPAATQ